MIEFTNTVKLLRFPFSIFLLPITLFSLFYIHPELNYKLIAVLITWHLLVFPSSNGYNSYHDNDEGPIGGLSAPPKPTKLLFYTSNGMDLAAILLALSVNPYFALFVALYIIASRLYSNRKIRLKKYPIPGFLVVFIFQGLWIFYANIIALSPGDLLFHPAVILSAVSSSFLIATIYPITQIYQHEADRKDGVETLSMVLGGKGTFVFSTFMFLVATALIYFSFNYTNTIHNFWLFNLVMLPSTLFFLVWAFQSFKNPIHINFRNAMIMLIMSSLLNNLFFFILLLN